MKKRFLYIVILILILLLFLGISAGVILVSQRTSFFGKAVTFVSSEDFEPANSYIFCSPLQATANGAENIRITVFVLNSQGLGIPDTPVALGQDKRLNINAIQNITDRQGKAIFDVSSQTPGEYIIDAMVKGKLLEQTVKVVFK